MTNRRAIRLYGPGWKPRQKQPIIRRASQDYTCHHCKKPIPSGDFYRVGPGRNPWHPFCRINVLLGLREARDTD